VRQHVIRVRMGSRAPPKGRKSIMDENTKLLKTIAAKLELIADLLGKPPLQEALVKQSYSCGELSKLTKLYGCQAYETFTVRLACSQGRIPADKRTNGNWSIPKKSVFQVLEHGIAPESELVV
jgi:hypothetical protein